MLKLMIEIENLRPNPDGFVLTALKDKLRKEKIRIYNERQAERIAENRDSIF